MSTLVAIAYDDPYRAEDVRLTLRKMQRDYLLDLDDAVVAVKDDKGRIRLDQPHNLTGAGAVGGGFWGALIGLLFMAPLLGMAVGAAAGAISGALTDVGLDDKFVKELAGTMKPRSSVLFALKGTGGKILRSSLAHEDEAKLQRALSTVKAA